MKCMLCLNHTRILDSDFVVMLDWSDHEGVKIFSVFFYILCISMHIQQRKEPEQIVVKVIATFTWSYIYQHKSRHSNGVVYLLHINDVMWALIYANIPLVYIRNLFWRKLSISYFTFQEKFKKLIIIKKKSCKVCVIEICLQKNI